MKADKNICFIVTDAISFNVLYRGQLEYLKESGNELTLICGGSETEMQRLDDRQVGRLVEVEFVRPPRLMKDIKALIQIIRHLKSKRYNTIVVTTPKAILLGAVAAWLTGQPRRVVFFRGRVYENFSGLARIFYSALDKLAARCAHEVLFVSKSLMYEYCRDSSVFSRKGRVLGSGSGNGVCGELFDPKLYTMEDVNCIRTKLGLSQSDFVILIVGRLCVDKGLVELSELASMAANENTRVKFLAVGQVEDGTQALFDKVMSQGNVLHVDFTQDVRQYFALADVHLFLTHREGFGNVAVEAAVMGVPTIAFDVVGVRDSVCEGVSGTRVPFGDVQAVWHAILDMQNDPEAAELRYSGAREWALKNFSRASVWKLYKDFYAIDDMEAR